MGPMMLIAVAFLALLPWGFHRVLLHGVLMAVAGAAILLVARKVVSLE